MWVSQKKYNNLKDNYESLANDRNYYRVKSSDLQVMITVAEERIQELEKKEYKLLDKISDAIYALRLATGEIYETKSKEVTPTSSNTTVND